MRITNTMMVNTSLLNLNRGLEKLQKFDTQVQTGKKISTASENPIIASKSMKYATRLNEISQYESNASAATSWLQSSETALGTTTSILKRMRVLIEQCASETLSDEDRLSSQVELVELRDQLTQEANSSVAGRYIFSGFKTDEKVLFDTPSEKEFHLYETLDYSNVTETLTDATGINTSYSVKMLYHNVSDLSVKIGDEVYTEDGSITDGCLIVYKNQTDADAYNPPKVDDTVTPSVKTIHIIKETGEIVFEKEHYNTINQNIDVEYNKSGFESGEPNPVHYLQCAEKVNLSPTRVGNAGETIVINKLGGIKEDSLSGMYIDGNAVFDDDGNVNAPYTLNYTKSTDLSKLGANEIRVNMDTGTLQFGDNIDDNSVVTVESFYEAIETPGKIISSSEVKNVNPNIGTLNGNNVIKLTNKGTVDSNSISNLTIDGTNIIVDGEVQAGYTVKYTTSDDVTALGNNEIRINTDTGEIVCGTSFTAGMEVTVDKYAVTKITDANEEIQYEINSNSKLTVNSLASDIFTVDMIKDLDLIINRIENFDRDKVTELCGRALTQIDNHLERTLKETSIIGSKINRVQLVETRLEDDEINFKELKSDNEDIDETEALTNLALQELVYTASMNATAKILQQSLLDFLQ